jgi:hypothetical protein
MTPYEAALLWVLGRQALWLITYILVLASGINLGFFLALHVTDMLSPPSLQAGQSALSPYNSWDDTCALLRDVLLPPTNEERQMNDERMLASL